MNEKEFQKKIVVLQLALKEVSASVGNMENSVVESEKRVGYADSAVEKKKIEIADLTDQVTKLRKVLETERASIMNGIDEKKAEASALLGEAKRKDSEAQSNVLKSKQALETANSQLEMANHTKEELDKKKAITGELLEKLTV